MALPLCGQNGNRREGWGGFSKKNIYQEGEEEAIRSMIPPFPFLVGSFSLWRNFPEELQDFMKADNNPVLGWPKECVRGTAK